MIEIRYNKATGVVTGVWADRHGNHEAKLKNRPDEAIALVDAPIPMLANGSHLYDELTPSIVGNPEYVGPVRLKSTLQVVEELEARIAKLEKQKGG